MKEKNALSPLVLGAIGIVYGDIGTSPLYTLKAVFSAAHAPAVNEANILGILSVIFWSLIIVVSIKYIAIVMRADNQGEGGVVALTALALRRYRLEHKEYIAIMILGILAAGLFYGDSVITPAISVLSAIEGLKVAAPSLHHVVLPLAIVVLTLLFLFQYKGTDTVGHFFGPVMAVWFLTIAVLGIASIIENPSVLRALNPMYAAHFIANNKFIGFLALGATFLALTGAEALYADMGHFGLKPIRVGWFCFVFPALVLCYFGQGAVILNNGQAIHNPFYMLSPDWLLYPLIVLATVATVIASQSVISGTFSMTQSAIRLGFLPASDVRYTSEKKKGQIYIPTINWTLFVVVLAVVLGFKTSDNLAAAYGLSVTGTMLITTILAFCVIISSWNVPWWVVTPLFAVFFAIDFTFLSANSLKFFEGGWLPLSIAAIVFTMMTTWRKGAHLLRREVAKKAIPIPKFLKDITALAPMRVPGTGVYMTPTVDAVPPALYCNLTHNKILHERVILLVVDFMDRPHVKEEERVEVNDLHSNNIFIIRIRYGFKDDIDVPEALTNCKGLKFDINDSTFFVGRVTLILDDVTKLAKWRKRLFIGMFHNSKKFIDYCKIPSSQIVELGTSIEM